jgi:TM2 domain-containing membrane protein YozV
MSKALMRQSSSGGSGVVPAVCSALIPGVGQLVNGEGSKAVGVFAVSVVCGVCTAIPLVGGVFALAGAVTWLYGVGDAYVTGKRGKR